MGLDNAQPNRVEEVDLTLDAAEQVTRRVDSHVDHERQVILVELNQGLLGQTIFNVFVFHRSVVHELVNYIKVHEKVKENVDLILEVVLSQVELTLTVEKTDEVVPVNKRAQERISILYVFLVNSLQIRLHRINFLVAQLIRQQRVVRVNQTALHRRYPLNFVVVRQNSRKRKNHGF